jgi:hypothetical protein
LSCQLLLAVQPVALVLLLPDPCLLGLASFLLRLLDVCHTGDVQADVDPPIRDIPYRQNPRGHRRHLEDSYSALQSHSLAFSISLGQFASCHLIAFFAFFWSDAAAGIGDLKLLVAAAGDLKSETALITSASFVSM